jgi:hypothetical protein
MFNLMAMQILQPNYYLNDCQNLSRELAAVTAAADAANNTSHVPIPPPAILSLSPYLPVCLHSLTLICTVHAPQHACNPFFLVQILES